MAKSSALGTILRVESDTSGVFTKVGNLTSIGVPSPTKPQIDTTDFDSVAAESIAGLPDNGEVTLSGFFNYADAGQLILIGDAHDPDATARDFQIDFTRQDLRFSFSAEVTSFAPNAGGPGEAYTFDATLRISGSVILTTPIPSN
ncbi:MAG TPA: hypothetical protein VF167_02935 [Longimicrobiaceae bacterium]